MKRIFLWTLLGMLMPLHGMNQWSWLYSKRFSSEELTEFQRKSELVFVKYDTHPFTQLLFSWNARRPQGYFSFSVSARNSKTKQWYPWHRMIDWGMQAQQSFISTTAHETNYYHVRLEIPQGQLADAFRIKIDAVNGADLSLLRGLFVSVNNSHKFVPETYNPELASLKSVHIQHVPQLSQMILKHPRAEHLCSPTSLSMLVGYLLQTSIDPVQFCEKMYDRGLESYGSWPFGIAHAYEGCQGAVNFCVLRLNSFADVHHQLMQGIPVQVSVRGELKDAAKEYSKGHHLLVVGWDAKHKKVICHDPAFVGDENTKKAYELNSFLKAWERSFRLAYIAEPVAS